MSNNRGNKLLKIHERMKDVRRRGNFEDQWIDATTYVLPRKDDIHDWNVRVEGEKKNLRLYDSTAQHINELFAAALMTFMTNPATQWFELATGIPEIDRIPRVKRYFQEVTKRFHKLLSASNFYTELAECNLDLGALGTDVLYQDDDPDFVFRFMSLPIFQFFIKENWKGEVDTVSREMKMSVRQGIQQYGEKVFHTPEMKTILEDKSKDIEVVNIVMPRLDADGMSPKSFPFASFHIEKSTGTILKESGFREMPYIVSRWTKTSGEVHGRGPAMKAMPDIKMMQSMMKTTLRGAQKIVDPPLLIPDDGVIGRVNTTPGGLNSFRSGTKDRIEPLQTGGNPGIGVDLLKVFEEKIKKAFFADQLQLREADRMTATEVDQRTDEALRLFGPNMVRQQTEKLQPMVSRGLGQMKRAGEMPEDFPPELEGISPKVFYVSQIAKAQRLGDLQSLNLFVTSIQAPIQLDPSTYDLINSERLVREYQDLTGAPESIFATEEELEEKRALRRQKIQKQEQEQTELLQAEVAQKAGPTVLDGLKQLEEG